MHLLHQEWTILMQEVQKVLLKDFAATEVLMEIKSEIMFLLFYLPLIGCLLNPR